MKPFKIIKQVVLIVTLLLSNAVFALKPVVLTDSLEELCIAREYVEYLEDPSCDMTIADILRLGDKSERFIPSTAQDLKNENINSAYWLRFKVKNESNSLKPFRIELFDFDIDEIAYFYPDTNGNYIEQKAGFSLPFYNRQIGHKNVSFKIPVHTPASSYMYMRFYSTKSNVLEPMVRSYDRIFNYALSEYLLFGGFYGLLVLMIFYNLLYFLSLRKGYYFYYVLFGCGMLIYLMSRNGTGFQYLWPGIPQINEYTGEIGMLVSTLAMLMFTSSFLRLRVHSEKLFRILIAGGVLRCLIFCIQFIYPHYYLFELIDAFYFIGIFLLALYIYKYTMSSAKWLIIAYAILNVSFVVTILEQVTFISSGIVTVYSVNLGIILQFVFLSIGIAETVKETYKEKNEAQANLIFEYQRNEVLKEKVNRELEEKVKERTKALDKANEELRKKAEENLKMNVALDVANTELKKYLNNFAISSVTKVHLDFEDFKKAYPDEFSCITYLRDLKEKKGFVCIKCGNDKHIKGKAKFDLRCSKCNYNESLTANTVFHRTKFPLQKAFYMLYLIFQKRGEISAAELARTLDLQNATCQNFKTKVMLRLKERKKSSKQKGLSWDYIILDVNKTNEV